MMLFWYFLNEVSSNFFPLMKLLVVSEPVPDLDTGYTCMFKLRRKPFCAIHFNQIFFIMYIYVNGFLYSCNSFRMV